MPIYLSWDRLKKCFSSKLVRIFLKKCSQKLRYTVIFAIFDLSSSTYKLTKNLFFFTMSQFHFWSKECSIANYKQTTDLYPVWMYTQKWALPHRSSIPFTHACLTSQCILEVITYISTDIYRPLYLEYFQNAMECTRFMCKWDVTILLIATLLYRMYVSFKFV